MTQLAKVEPNTFTDDQKLLIKQTIAPKASDNELRLFIAQCERTKLDPFSRQIYCIHLGGKMSIQVSIDGFRVIAERSGNYAGQDKPVFHYDDKNRLTACEVTVYKWHNEQRYPAAVGVAMWSEYSQNNTMWNKMPHTMLSKCAEALALRKAYPQDLSGLYTMDEMQQAQPAEVIYEDLKREPDLTIGPAIVDTREPVKPQTKTAAAISMQHGIDLKKAIKDAERCGSVSALSHFIEMQPESIRKDVQFQGACIDHKQNLQEALAKEKV
jgi:phage recombination protein Bet